MDSGHPHPTATHSLHYKHVFFGGKDIIVLPCSAQINWTIKKHKFQHVLPEKYFNLKLFNSEAPNWETLNQI